MKNRIHNKYYKQILLTMFVVSLVPVFFLGYYVFSFVEQQMHAAYRSYSSGLENEKKEFGFMMGSSLSSRADSRLD